MSTLAIEVEPLAVDVSCTDSALRVLLADGREISFPCLGRHVCWQQRPKQEAVASNWRWCGHSLGSYR